MSRAASYTGSKAKEIAQEDYAKASQLAQSAISSGSFWYPIKGIFYLTSHRALWKPLLSRLLPTMTLSVAVVAFMFSFVYIPQAIALSFVNGPIAAVSSVLLTLSESSTIITLLSRSFLINEALVDTFDGTMVAKNQTELVSGGRQIKAGGDPINKLGKLVKRPFEKFTPKAIIRYFLYLPLNLIPVVGTTVFLYFQGRNRGYSIHNRYFQLKDWSQSQKKEYVKKNEGAYTAFGTVATLLELVPLASILFSFTNTVGAALWAADMEAEFKRESSSSGSTADSHKTESNLASLEPLAVPQI